MKNYFKYIAVLALGIVSCEPELENAIEDGDQYSNGSADFSNYVALGNSLTAGYADGALYITGQQNSYPNILASKFALTQDTDGFTQPLVNDNYGGLILNGEPVLDPSGNNMFDTRFVLSFLEGDDNPTPRRYRGNESTTDITNKLNGPFNNMGVPGAKSYHLLAENYGNVAGIATGMANPYFARFASSDNATVLEDALAQQPTFFTLWIGNNDVLSYATSGGTGVYQENVTDFTQYGPNDITDPNAFAGVYNALVSQLTANGAGGVVLNIPNVTSVPYFTTVPFAPLSPEDEDFGPQIPTLNSTFAPLNQAFAFLQSPERSISFSETSASAVLIKDESLPDLSQQLTEVLQGGGLDPATAALYGAQYGQSRQATEEDLLLLTSSSVIGTVNQQRMQELMGFGLDQQTAARLSVNGVTYPLQDQYVLTPEEQDLVENATLAYNVAISQIAEANSLGYVDANQLLNQIGAEG
ncbi:MAG: G-D-S-L family lipolytic protein, partial [Christiangramia sp.]|nr:G-D-S-L family lipolytic protein [Christiangramia sp.]